MDVWSNGCAAGNDGDSWFADECGDVRGGERRKGGYGVQGGAYTKAHVFCRALNVHWASCTSLFCLAYFLTSFDP